MKILIGSTAIAHWFKDFKRIPKDTDYAVDYNSAIKEPGIEYLYNPVLCKYASGSEIATPDELYTLKLSHTVGWKLKNNSWGRHVWDVQFLKSKGAKLIRPLFDELYEFWGTIHGPNKRSNLEMSAEDFFDNALDYPVDHDALHELLIQHPYFEGQNEPTYKKILKGEVDVSMDKFNDLSEKEKTNVVIEEVMVMALERWSNIGYLHAFQRMIDKFIREHAKIDEAIWILENYKKLYKAPFNYVKFLNEQINGKRNNIIKRSTRFVEEQV